MHALRGGVYLSVHVAREGICRNQASRERARGPATGILGWIGEMLIASPPREKQDSLYSESQGERNVKILGCNTYYYYVSGARYLSLPASPLLPFPSPPSLRSAFSLVSGVRPSTKSYLECVERPKWKWCKPRQGKLERVWRHTPIPLLPPTGRSARHGRWRSGAAPARSTSEGASRLKRYPISAVNIGVNVNIAKG
eukprot:scaffold95399_cov31-Tisochrysis_lutea.AAC.7